MTVTLQEWCISSLGNKVEETELLDKDAQNSKEYQQILISDVLSKFKSDEIFLNASATSDDLSSTGVLTYNWSVTPVDYNDDGLDDIIFSDATIANPTFSIDKYFKDVAFISLHTHLLQI